MHLKIDGLTFDIDLERTMIHRAREAEKLRLFPQLFRCN